MKLRTFFNTVVFYLLFGCRTANFNPVSKGRLHKPDVKYICLFKVGFLKPDQGSGQVWTGNFLIDNNGQNLTSV